MDIVIDSPTNASHTNPMKEASPSEPVVNARLIIELHEPSVEGGDLVPVVTCPLPGRLTIGMIDRLLPSIFNEVHRAQQAKSVRDVAAQKDRLNASL